MSHILIVGAGPAGLAAALRLAERGQRITLAAAKPPIYNRCAGLPGIDLPEEDTQLLRTMGAQNLSGHEVMQAFSRRLLRYEADGHIRYLPYHRLLRLVVAEEACAGGVLLNEYTDTVEGVPADAVLLATGGMHSMFAENRHGCDGAAAALAFQVGAALRNPDHLPGGGKYPICTGGLITSWDGETTLPGLYAAGECADGTAQAFPFAQALATGTATADAIAETLPEADKLESECAVSSAVTRVQQQLDAFRQTKGTRAPAAVEQRIRDTVQRVLAGERTAKMLQRGLLDIKVMRQQAARGGYDLGEGLYQALRLPMLLQLLEVMLTTAVFRLLRQDGELTAVQRGDNIEVTAKRSAAVEAAAQDFGVTIKPGMVPGAEKLAEGSPTGEDVPPEPSLKDDLWRANAPARPAKAVSAAETAPEQVAETIQADPNGVGNTVVLRPGLAEQLAAIPATEQTIVFASPARRKPDIPQVQKAGDGQQPAAETRKIAVAEPVLSSESVKAQVPPAAADSAKVRSAPVSEGAAKAQTVSSVLAAASGRGATRRTMMSLPALEEELSALAATPMLDADMKRMSAVNAKQETKQDVSVPPLRSAESVKISAASSGRSAEPEKAPSASLARSAEPEKAPSASPVRSAEPEKAPSASSMRSAEPEKVFSASPVRGEEAEIRSSAPPIRGKEPLEKPEPAPQVKSTAGSEPQKGPASGITVPAAADTRKPEPSAAEPGNLKGTPPASRAGHPTEAAAMAMRLNEAAASVKRPPEVPEPAERPGEEPAERTARPTAVKPQRRAYEPFFMPDPEDLLAMTPEPAPQPKSEPVVKPVSSPTPEPAVKPKPEPTSEPPAKPFAPTRSQEFTAIPDPEDLLKL